MFIRLDREFDLDECIARIVNGNPTVGYTFAVTNNYSFDVRAQSELLGKDIVSVALFYLPDLTREELWSTLMHRRHLSAYLHEHVARVLLGMPERTPLGVYNYYPF